MTIEEVLEITNRIKNVDGEDCISDTEYFTQYF